MRYTQKQIEKYRRQKYINLINKIGKNLFKMFRDESIDSRKFMSRFSALMGELDSFEEIQINNQFVNSSRDYFRKLYLELSKDDFDDSRLNEIRDIQMSNLNRLQKIKNRSSYKKEKYRSGY